MTSFRQRLARIALAAFTAFSASHRPASALIVTCATCGTEWTQLANNLQLADQLARQVELVRQALKRYENMLVNTQRLDDQLFGDAAADLRKLTALFDEAKSLSITAANLDAQFAEKFKDYQTYLKEKLGVAGLGAKYRQWSEDTNSSVLTALKAAKLHSDQMTGSETALFSGLEGMAGTAEGRMQALQVANQIALAAARQTQKLRQLMLTQLQLQANHIQTQMDRQMAKDAALDSFVRSGADRIDTRDGKGF
jgi:P-type conjugative transfer protein TrbJ